MDSAPTRSRCVCFRAPRQCTSGCNARGSGCASKRWCSSPPQLQALADRLPQVLHISYLLFNEGYSSAQPERLIRRELCEEAIRLSLLLVVHPVGAAARYHLEAAIAAEYCLAPSYAQTRWDEIARPYEELETVSPSPLNVLNRAIVLAEWKGPDAGLTELSPELRF